MTADREAEPVAPEPTTPGPAAPEAPLPPATGEPTAPDQAVEATLEAATPDLPITEPLIPSAAPPLPDVVPVMSATQAPTTEAPATSRGKRLALGTWRIARPMISLGLLVIGIVLGATAFGAVQPKDPDVLADAPSSVQPPAAVREFISALGANDSDALRASVPADPYRLLAGELETRGYQEVTSVDTLGTILDGDRSATEIVIHGSASSGQGIVINLVVHANNGVIVNFR